MGRKKAVRKGEGRKVVVAEWNNQGSGEWLIKRGENVRTGGKEGLHGKNFLVTGEKQDHE